VLRGLAQMLLDQQLVWDDTQGLTILRYPVDLSGL
jgi:hypothetical protein